MGGKVNAYFRRIDRKVFNFDESSGAFSGAVAADADDMAKHWSIYYSLLSLLRVKVDVKERSQVDGDGG